MTACLHDSSYKKTRSVRQRALVLRGLSLDGRHLSPVSICSDAPRTSLCAVLRPRLSHALIVRCLYIKRWPSFPTINSLTPRRRGHAGPCAVWAQQENAQSAPGKKQDMQHR